MRISAGTAPPLILLAVVGWAVWPYLESPGSNPRSKPQVAEIPSALLARATTRAPDRDPFRSPREPAAGESARPPSPMDPAANAPGAGPAAAPGRQARPAAPARGEAELTARAEAEVRATLPGQVSLSATSIRGEHRMAVLNGRTYAEGEAVGGIAAPGPVVLAAVRPGSVRLRCGGTTFDVAFSSALATTSPPPAASARPPNRGRGGAARPDSARKTTRPRRGDE